MEGLEETDFHQFTEGATDAAGETRAVSACYLLFLESCSMFGTSLFKCRNHAACDWGYVRTPRSVFDKDGRPRKECVLQVWIAFECDVDARYIEATHMRGRNDIDAVISDEVGGRIFDVTSAEVRRRSAHVEVDLMNWGQVEEKGRLEMTLSSESHHS